MLHRLCGSPSIPLSFNLATVLPRRYTYRVSCGAQRDNSSHTKCTPFKVRTTRVSNPVCSPNFRASASVSVQRAAFATGVPLDIYAFHRYTKNSALLSSTLVWQFRMHFHSSVVGFHIRHTKPPTLPLRPVNPNNARDLCITAAAGTELAVSSSCGTIIPKDYSSPGHLSHMTGVYNPKTFILHATSHRQAFAHCE